MSVYSRSSFGCLADSEQVSFEHCRAWNDDLMAYRPYTPIKEQELSQWLLFYDQTWSLQ